MRNRKFLRSYNPLKISDAPDQRIACKTLSRTPTVTPSSEGRSPQTAVAPPQASPSNIEQQQADQLPVPNLMYPQPDGSTDDVPVGGGHEEFVPAPEQQAPHAGTPVQAPRFVLAENQSQPAPPPMTSPVAPSPVPRRSGRRQTQMPSRYGDFYTGQQFEQATTEINFMDSSYPYSCNSILLNPQTIYK